MLSSQKELTGLFLELKIQVEILVSQRTCYHKHELETLIA
jgi:hypothetical protein